MPRILTKEEISKYPHHLTVGDLKKILAQSGLPDDAKVLVERVEDFYYEENNWGVYLRHGEYSLEMLGLMQAQQSGELNRPDIDPVTENDVIQSMEQYHPAHWANADRDNKDMLFIHLHY